MAKIPNGIETLPKISIAWVGCTNVTDDRRQTDDRQTDDRQTDRQTDGRRHIANMNMSSRSLKTGIERRAAIKLLFFMHISAANRNICTKFGMYGIYSVSQKSSPSKRFAIFSLVVNLCNWKLPWLLPTHIPMFTPILVHLSEYLYELYHFY